MEVEYLTKEGFIEIENIEELKISKGKVEFESDGKTSKIIEPDLRYYWDGERFGLHVSDINSTINVEQLFDSIGDIKKYLEIVYLDNLNIESLNFSLINYGNLKCVILRQCSKLKKIELKAHVNSINISNSLTENKVTKTLTIGETNMSLEEIHVNDCNKLVEIQFTGKFEKLETIEVINCGLKTFNTPKFSKRLSYFNLNNNQISSAIDLTDSTELKYFFGLNNPEITLQWPKNWNLNKLSILGIDKSNKKISKDIIEIAQSYSDEELQQRIKSFLGLRETLLKDLKYKGETYLNRKQIVLIGNTTSGKTELKYRFLNKKRPANVHSTHGVQHFTKIIDDGTEVVGFDFGGQDYYHALHIPFFDDESHFILVWGNHLDKTWGSYEADKFYGKNEEITINDGKDKILIKNLLYPINYWLKSINSNYNRLKIQSISENIEAESVKTESFNGRSVDIIQNIRSGTSEHFLNVRDLKSRIDLGIEEIRSFDFNQKIVGNWLTTRIKKLGPTHQNVILLSVLNIGKKLLKSPKAILKKEELEQFIKGEFPELSEPQIDEFIESLRRNRYIYYPGHLNKKLAGFYIIHIEKFSEFIYQVLSKELVTSDQNQGYFYKKDALQRIKNNDKEVKEYVLSFLLKSEIIFEIAGSEPLNQKYVAPTYLPNPKNKVELLFIESFEQPDCKFEFHDFFHPNLMLQVVKEYYEKNLLVKDEEVNEYLIWKNCVIIYNNQSSKNYLKLELVLPDEEYPDLIPKFTISRSNAGFIPNDQFKLIFSEIKESLAKYNPIIRVKTAFDTYIDLKDVESANNLVEGKNKKSQFVYSNGVLYPKYDFRHFCGDSFEAPIKIFVAYSKADDLYRLELRDHLLPGINEGKFIVFDDREMDLGEKWHARLKKELEQCDIFIVLVSVKLLGTAYVMNIEIPEAKARIEKGNLEKIVPIMVSPCDWTKTGLSDLNVHDKAQSITLEDISGEVGINERASKWSEIVKEIEKFKTSNSNGTNPPNSPTSPDEHLSGADQTNGGE